MNIRPCSIGEVKALCARYHAYGDASNTATYAFGVYEDARLVAAYAWQPPPPGAAKSVNPVAPHGVLALSRMVAVPKEERLLKHISKPLRQQMKHLIDRTRWPSLVTYSDEGLGHTGYVYQCSGWTPTARNVNPQYTDAEGRRASTYTSGRRDMTGLTRIGAAVLQRWEHHVVPVTESADWMRRAGWRRVAIPGKVWRSGQQAYHLVNTPRPRRTLPADCVTRCP